VKIFNLLFRFWLADCVKIFSLLWRLSLTNVEFIIFPVEYTEGVWGCISNAGLLFCRGDTVVKFNTGFFGVIMLLR
jgi:hypothetical protein